LAESQKTYGKPGDIRRKFWNSHFRMSEIPVEFYSSLAVPTTKLGAPAYILVCGPGVVAPKGDRNRIRIDRIIGLDAETGRLLKYEVLLNSEVTSTPGRFESIAREFESVIELDTSIRSLDKQLGALAPAFFAGEIAPSETAASVLQGILETTPEIALAALVASASDFFNWLDEGSR
jgi:hypothetical protein